MTLDRRGPSRRERDRPHTSPTRSPRSSARHLESAPSSGWCCTGDGSGDGWSPRRSTRPRRSSCGRCSRWCPTGRRPRSSSSAAGPPGGMPVVCGRCSSRPRRRASCAGCRRRPVPGPTRASAGGAGRGARSPSPLEREIADATFQGLCGAGAILRLPPAAPSASPSSRRSSRRRLGRRRPPRPRGLEKRRGDAGGPPRSGRATRWPFSPRRGRRRPREGGSSSAHARRRARPGGSPERASSCSTPTPTPTRKSACRPGRPPCSRRARPAGRGPCLLVSPCPTLDLLAGRRLVTLSRDAERAGLGAARADRCPGRGPASRWVPLAAGLGDPRRRPESEPGRPVVAVLNRKGRPGCSPASAAEPASLRRLRLGARPARARHAAGELAMLECPACSSVGPGDVRLLRADPARGSSGPASPGSARTWPPSRGSRWPRSGVRAARAALRRLPDAPVLIGTEAVLHRAGSASIVVFPDFDHELLAPALPGRRAGPGPARSRLAPRRRAGEGRAGSWSGLDCRTTRCWPRPCTPIRGAWSRSTGRAGALLRLPPTTALALLSGEGAAEFVQRLRLLAAPRRGGRLGPGAVPRAGGRARTRWPRPSPRRGRPARAPASRSTRGTCSAPSGRFESHDLLTWSASAQVGAAGRVRLGRVVFPSPRRVGVAGPYSKKVRLSRMPDKTATITEHRLHETDTGSSEVQVALLTGRINHLTEHLKVHRGDHHTRRGLMKLIGRRRRLLDYVKDNDVERYRSLISRLGIRR